MAYGKELMDEFHAESVLVDSDSFERKLFWDGCESMVNNLHHGLYAHEWLPRFHGILTDWKRTKLHEVPDETYDEAIAIVDKHIEIIANLNS